jgi:hypothetical protein
MFAGDDDDDSSDGVPRTPVPAITAEPTDKTIRGFVMPMDTAAVTGVPVVGPDAPTAAIGDGDIADGSIDSSPAPAVPTITDDAPTMQVTPLDVGYRYAVLRQVASLICHGGAKTPRVPHLAGRAPIEVHVDHDSHKHVVVTIRYWRGVAAWVRREALDDFVALKSTLAKWPDEVRVGARAVLRQLTEACHQSPQPAADGLVYLWL